MSRRLILRSEWGARPATKTTHQGTVSRLYLHHTAGSVNQTPGDIQHHHLFGRKWRDIAYQLLANQRGQALEGCGPMVMGSHTKGQNGVAKAICAIGNFQEVQPSDDLLDAITWLVAEGLLQGWWDCQITGPHSSAPGARTACCGSNLAARIPEINREAAAIVHALRTPTPVVPPRFNPPFDTAPVVADLPAPGGGAWFLAEDGGVFAIGGAPFYGSPVGQDYWGGRRAADLRPHGVGYVVVASSGETYHYPAS